MHRISESVEWERIIEAAMRAVDHQP